MEKSIVKSKILTYVGGFSFVGGFSALLLIRDREFLVIFVGLAILAVISVFVSLYFLFEEIKEKSLNSNGCRGVCANDVNQKLEEYQNEVVAIKDVLNSNGLIDLIKVNASNDEARFILLIFATSITEGKIELRGKGAQKSNIKLIPSSVELSCNEILKLEQLKSKDSAEIEEVFSVHKMNLKKGINYCQFEIDSISYSKAKLSVRIIVEDVTKQAILESL